MSVWSARLAAILGLSTTDEGLSAESARNADGRARLAELRHNTLQEKGRFENAIEKELARVKSKQEEYHQAFKPLLSEFDDLASAAHSYEMISRLMENESFTAEHVQKKEAIHYGYVGKKLISISVNFEALKGKMNAGLPFVAELEATLEDSENEDLRKIATPLLPFAGDGVPSDAAARAEAFILSQTIEEAGKSIEQKPLKSWLDFLRFRSSLSPASLAENRLEARRHARDFMQSVKDKEYILALELVEKSKTILEKQHDPLLGEFRHNEEAFIRVVNPILAANMFVDYATANLTCNRFANVEKVVQS